MIMQLSALSLTEQAGLLYNSLSKPNIISMYESVGIDEDFTWI